MSRVEYYSSSREDTMRLGSELVEQYPQGGVFCLEGDLGAGKTTFVKGVAQALGIDPRTVTSPTYSYLNIYNRLHHFDLYRLTSASDFQHMGLEEYLYVPGFIFIEWSERIDSLLPKTAVIITLTPIDETTRKICYTFSD